MKSLVVIVQLIALASSAKILGIFHYPSRDYYVQGSALLKGLARAGHHVTMISPYSYRIPMENYTDVRIPGLTEQIYESTIESLINKNEKSAFNNYFSMENLILPTSELVLNNSEFQYFLLSNQSFDLIVIGWMYNEAFLALGDYFQAPVIVYSPTGDNTVVHNIYKNSFPLSYIPNIYMPYTDEMSFTERLQNTLFSIYLNVYLRTLYLDKQEALMKKYFPNTRPVKHLIENVSLLFMNSHFSITYPRPELPNMINIGGIHIEHPKPLSKNIEKFFDNAPHGVVFFSLGSYSKNFQLPMEKLQVIANSLAQLSAKVLWKFDGTLENIPTNVMIQSWLPPGDVLSHRNVKCFVTHGDLLSLTDAVYHGVPIVGVPFFGHQRYNVAKIVKMGMGLFVKSDDLNEFGLVKAINEVLHNGTYRENARKRSILLRDQPMKPLDKAIFWVEYVLRHKDTNFLKTGGEKLEWYQLYLLDVIAVVALIVSVTLLMFCCTLRGILRHVCKKSHKRKID